MKSFTFPTVKLSFVTLLLACSTIAFSQRTTTWKGGTPGMTTDWHCPSNWSTYAVPDEFSNVVIHDVTSSTLAHPEITKGRITVNSIYMQSNASLIIGKGAQLFILDKEASYIPDNQRIKGTVFILEEAQLQAHNAVTASND